MPKRVYNYKKRCIWVEYRRNRISYSRYCGALRPISYKRIKSVELIKMREEARNVYCKYKKREAERRRRYKVKEAGGEFVSQILYEVHECERCMLLKENVNLFWGVTLCDKCYYTPKVLYDIIQNRLEKVQPFINNPSETYETDEEDVCVDPFIHEAGSPEAEDNQLQDLENHQDECMSDDPYLDLTVEGTQFFEESEKRVVEEILKCQNECLMPDSWLDAFCLKKRDDQDKSIETISEISNNKILEEIDEKQTESEELTIEKVDLDDMLDSLSYYANYDSTNPEDEKCYITQADLEAFFQQSPEE